MEAREHALIIESYTDDKYGPNALLLGFTGAGRPLHIQVSLAETQGVKIVTIYEPDPDEWIAHVVREYAMVKIVCWNINRSDAAYPALQEMDADVALLQEVSPNYVPDGVDIGPYKPWDKHPYDRWPAVAKLSDRVEVKWFEPVPLDVDEAEDKIAVSDLPTRRAPHLAVDARASTICCVKVRGL